MSCIEGNEGTRQNAKLQRKKRDAESTDLYTAWDGFSLIFLKKKKKTLHLPEMLQYSYMQTALT